MDNGIFELIRKAQGGDKSALELIITQNDRLVWSILRRFSGKGYETEDLYQLGCIGLVKAVQKFDFNKNVQFSTYAVPMILGEIRKFLRDDGAVKVSRSLKELAAKAKYAADAIAKETGTQPGVEELSQKLGVPAEDIAEALSASVAPISIYQPVHDGSELSVIDTVSDDDKYEKIIDIMAVKDAASLLPDREQSIIYMRYYQNKTQSEVARKMGISQVQVSRLEKKILEKLRQEIV